MTLKNNCCPLGISNCKVFDIKQVTFFCSMYVEYVKAFLKVSTTKTKN